VLIKKTSGLAVRIFGHRGNPFTIRLLPSDPLKLPAQANAVLPQPEEKGHQETGRENVCHDGSDSQDHIQCPDRQTKDRHQGYRRNQVCDHFLSPRHRSRHPLDCADSTNDSSAGDWGVSSFTLGGCALMIAATPAFQEPDGWASIAIGSQRINV
jgi:hypothetical protein